jgi:hypothetical protein
MMRQLKTKRDILLNEIKNVFNSIDNLAENGMDTKYKVVKAIKDKTKVNVIQGVIVVDCRSKKAGPYSKSHTGMTLMSSERAMYIFGHGDKDKFTTTVSCSGIGDTRTNMATLLSAVRGAIKVFNEHNKRYNADSRKPNSLSGGGITYKPVMVEISNYGYSVIADRNIYCIPAYDFSLE